MFDKIRYAYYHKLLGPVIGSEFAKFEHECEKIANGRLFAKKSLAWLTMMDPDERLSAIDVIRKRRDLLVQREEAVRAITQKNRIQMQLDYFNMIAPEVPENENQRAKRDSLNEQYQRAHGHVEELKETIRIRENLQRLDWEYLVEKYGELEV